MTKLNSIASLIERRRIAVGTVHFPVSDDWLQGRTCYGGLISTLALRAMRDVAGTTWPAEASLRSLQTCFVAPVSPGEVRIDVQLLREGRNVYQVQAQVRQGEQVAAALIGVFGADRPSALQQRIPQRPVARREADAVPPQTLPPGAPNFLQHFDMRWDDGAPPFSGGEGWTHRIHLRISGDEAASLSPELQTVLLADLPPTPAVSQLSKPSAHSSVSWALELRPVNAVTASGWWRADSESTMVDGGYVNHRVQLWAPGGHLAAYGYQVVAVFT